jgi:hypothetical protein
VPLERITIQFETGNPLECRGTAPASEDVSGVRLSRVDGGRIAAVYLFFDRVSFKPASEEVARRMAK